MESDNAKIYNVYSHWINELDKRKFIRKRVLFDIINNINDIVEEQYFLYYSDRGVSTIQDKRNNVIARNANNKLLMFEFLNRVKNYNDRIARMRNGRKIHPNVVQSNFEKDKKYLEDALTKFCESYKTAIKTIEVIEKEIKLHFY